jgi:hypothetical protein
LAERRLDRVKERGEGYDGMIQKLVACFKMAVLRRA